VNQQKVRFRVEANPATNGLELMEQTLQLFTERRVVVIVAAFFAVVVVVAVIF